MPPGRVLRRKEHAGDSGSDGAAANLALSMGGVVTRCFPYWRGSEHQKSAPLLGR